MSTRASLLAYPQYLHAAVEVHSVDTDCRVVLDTEINVLADTKTEVTGLGEVALAELIFLDLQATLQDFLGLWATDGNMNGDLLVTTNTEGTDSISGLAYEVIVSPISKSLMNMIESVL